MAWLLLCLTAVAAQAGDGLPFNPHVPGFQVTHIVRGREAIHEINKLHGMEIDVVQGVIVHYGGSRADQVTIWASEASSRDLAQKQVNVMIEKMKNNPRSPFSGYRTGAIGATPTIGFYGMGQAHSVFRVGSWVYWLSGQEQRMKEIIEHICPHP
jgi:hypothetical protein